MLGLPNGSSLVLSASVCAFCAPEVTVGTIGISCSKTNKRKNSFRLFLALGGWYQTEPKSQQRGTICFFRPGLRFCCLFCSRESPWDTASGHSLSPFGGCGSYISPLSAKDRLQCAHKGQRGPELRSGRRMWGGFRVKVPEGCVSLLEMSLK